jgi:hypothetical protein
MALNIKSPLGELNIIHQSMLLPVLFDGHAGDIWSLNVKICWIDLPFVHLMISEDTLIYAMQRCH